MPDHTVYQVTRAADYSASRKVHLSTHALTTDQPCSAVHDDPLCGPAPAN